MFISDTKQDPSKETFNYGKIKKSDRAETEKQSGYSKTGICLGQKLLY
jgi:hypothetical protein